MNPTAAIIASLCNVASINLSILTVMRSASNLAVTMGSKAYKAFTENAEDIEHLIDMHDGITDLFRTDNIDPPLGLGVLFPSAVVLMVSHWEAYVEDIVSEALEHLVTHVSDPQKLPKEIRKLIATELKESLNELAIWELAGKGWQKYLESRLAAFKANRDKNFNTPKSHQTAEFMRKAIGIEDVRTAWKFDGLTEKEACKKLDSIIDVRGKIAHRGRIGVTVDKAWISDHSKFIAKLASKTGGRVNRHLRELSGTPLWT